MKPLKYIDLFAGCGGLSLGLYEAGWSGLFAIEKDKFAFETLKYNLIQKQGHFSWVDWLETKEHDIKSVLLNHKTDLENLKNTITLVTGGPPLFVY
jgi:DNA (cytosine-5)-methyltransferase 1